MVSGPDLSIELSMLHSDDGSMSPDSPQHSTRVDCTIRVFRFVVLDNTQLYTSKV